MQISHTCRHCGAMFMADEYRMRKYCSIACGNQPKKDYAPKPLRTEPVHFFQSFTAICKHCGLEFTKSATIIPVYCSRDCTLAEQRRLRLQTLVNE